MQVLNIGGKSIVIVGGTTGLGFSPTRKSLGSQVAARLVELDDGQSAHVGDMEFRGIAAAHNTVERDALGRCRFLG
jgi:hypothetical protein